MTLREDRLLKLHWQVPDNLPFPMPVEVRVNDRIVALPMSDGTGRIVLENARDSITIDPRSRILMQSDAIDAYQEWQARQPPHQPHD